MYRKIFCYGIILFTSLLYLLDLLMIFGKISNNIIIIDMIILNHILIIIAIKLFGAPSNSPYEYFFKKNTSYERINKEGYVINVKCNDNGIWEFEDIYKTYKFNVKGWINQINRVRDLIYVQYHNDFCNKNKVINVKYLKNYFKELKIILLFHKKKKIIYKQFKPSFILKLKMVLSILRLPRQRDNSYDVKIRDLWGTFMVLKFINKSKNRK